MDYSAKEIGAQRRSREMMEYEEDLEAAATLVVLANGEWSRRSTIDSMISEQAQKRYRDEEEERYSHPYNAFTYTTFDGKKSSVAPLKRKPGKKPPNKPRVHPILKDNRPYFFTVLSLVRDAACRLPGRTGSRADIGYLVKDSRYVREDASESQIITVVSAALDRLKSEYDPCIKFNKEMQTWVYLHGDRTDDDYM